MCFAHEAILEKNCQLFHKNIKALNIISDLKHSKCQKKSKTIRKCYNLPRKMLQITKYKCINK